MKLFIGLISVLLVSCSSKPSNNLSFAQSGLYSLASDYKKEYQQAGNTIARSEIVAKYQDLLDTFVKHRAAYILDSMKVNLQSLDIDTSGKIRAVFIDSVCTYRYYGRFDNGDRMRQDSSYKILSRLSDQKQNLVRFFAANNLDYDCRVNEPNDTLKTFDIYVTPVKNYSK